MSELNTLDFTYCFVCKRMMKTKVEIKIKPYKREIWKCYRCGTILGIKGIE